MEKEVEVLREDGSGMVMDADENKDEDDDEDTEVAAARTVEGIAVSSCIWLASGFPPASPRAARPMLSAQRCRWM